MTPWAATARLGLYLRKECLVGLAVLSLAVGHTLSTRVDAGEVAKDLTHVPMHDLGPHLEQVMRL